MIYEGVRFRYNQCTLLIHPVLGRFLKKLVASTLYLWYTCSFREYAIGNGQLAIEL